MRYLLSCHTDYFVNMNKTIHYVWVDYTEEKLENELWIKQLGAIALQLAHRVF